MQTKHLFVLINTTIKDEDGTVQQVKPSCNYFIFQGGVSLLCVFFFAKL